MSPTASTAAAGPIQGILSNWGLSSYGNAYALSWNAVVSDVNASRPFVMRFGWYNGGGHSSSATATTTAAAQRVGYMNPWPGEALPDRELQLDRVGRVRPWPDAIRCA